MARSVVLRGTIRCPHCQIAPRWCICAEARALTLPFAVDVLMHSSEAWKPTSTGNLIQRVVPASRKHIYHHEKLPEREEVCGAAGGAPDGKRGDVSAGGVADSSGSTATRMTWILHPRGDSLADVLAAQTVPLATMLANLRVVLIDGTWSQANDMLRHVEGWGQRVNLPMAGESRYMLRTQHSAGHFSTIEALMFLLKALGRAEDEVALRLQFELHVYASLLARGHKARAEAYLTDSPLLVAAIPRTLERLRTGH